MSKEENGVYYNMLPNFLIIGAQRSGTTSLYNYLIQHPNIISAMTKEVHFFDLNFNKGASWYESQFNLNQKTSNNKYITGEASPYYIFHPLVPKRVFELLSDVKLIVLLRNPIDRAFSHYWYEKQTGAEDHSFIDAINSEPKRLEGEEQKILQNHNYYSFTHQNFSYLSRGIYVDQLKHWMSYFPRKQFLVIKSEDFFSATSDTLKKIFEFLDVQDFNLTSYEKYNLGKYVPMDDAVVKMLVEYFKPYNEQLYSYLNINFDW